MKPTDTELFKKRAKEEGSVRLIDIITARLDAKTDSFVATLPSLMLNDVRISSEFVDRHERMLTGGFYAEITLSYDGAIALERGGRPFSIEAIREIQLSKLDALEVLAAARKNFTTGEWKTLMLRSIGIEPEKLDERQKNAMLLRMVPFVERNYNMVELGPRGTGKSHLFQQISPYAHLISGGKATVAKMFVNNSNGQRGLVCQYDVVCFDEVSGVSFDQKDGVNIPGCMESGEFSRGKESIRLMARLLWWATDVDVEQQQRIGHLFGPLPLRCVMTRHSWIESMRICRVGRPKISKDWLTDHLVSDFLSECWSKLRTRAGSRSCRTESIMEELPGRDTNAVNKTVSGLLKLPSHLR